MFRCLAGRIVFGEYAVNGTNKLEATQSYKAFYQCITWRLASGSSKKAKKKVALHADFYEKVRKWKTLLKNEIASDVKEVKDSIAQCTSEQNERSGIISDDLQYLSQSFHPIYGRLITFTWQNYSTNTKGSSSFSPRPGAPVMLCKSDTLSGVQECIVHSYSDDEIRVKSKGKEEVPLSQRQKYVLIPSVGLGYLLTLEDFLELKWRYFPGEKLIHYIHCSTPLPFSRPDHTFKGNENLNEAQQRAVSAALNKTKPIMVIYGPPGTGKTAVIVEIVIQALLKKQKVLICAPSNVAVNSIIERIKYLDGVCTLALGSSFSLTSEMEQHSKFKEVQRVFDNLDSNHYAKRTKKSVEKKRAWRDANSMLTELKEAIIGGKKIIACTLTNSSLRILREQGFHPNLTIIDEAAQALECVAWYALLLAPRAIIVGDPWQLPPVLKTNGNDQKSDVGCSLLDAFAKRFGETISLTLTEQYRMNKNIMEWASQYFYDSSLTAHSSVANQTLSDISKVSISSIFNEPMLMIDTSEVPNQEIVCGHSYANHSEAAVVLNYINQLKKLGVHENAIGIIAPYTAQVNLLRKMTKLSDINSVDAFQGQEREVVIMSLVRSNKEGSIGFLHDERRLNVAVTRARRQFVLIGNSKIMRRAEHLSSLLSYIGKSGKVISATDLIQLARKAKDSQAEKVKNSSKGTISN